jgi:hypothetical protein
VLALVKSVALDERGKLHQWLARRQREKLMPVVGIIFVPADGVAVPESG